MGVLDIFDKFTDTIVLKENCTLEEEIEHLEVLKYKNPDDTETNREALKEKLIEFRKARSKEKNIPVYYVFTNEELEKILDLIPKTIEELEMSRILTSIKLKSHGAEIINVINEARELMV